MSCVFKKVLALDTAMSGCGAGVYDSATGKSFSSMEAMMRGQAEVLMPSLQDLMDEAEVRFSDLDAIVCTTGPGTFMGLRIGLSVAKALGMVLERPVFGITTLRALALQYAQAHKPEQAIGVVIETKRSDFYFQSFTADGAPRGEALAAVGTEIAATLKKKPCILIGDGVERFLVETKMDSATDPAAGVIDPAFLARLLCEMKADPDIFCTPPVPVYLRGADVSVPKNLPRTLESQEFRA